MNTPTRCPHCKEITNIPFGTLGKAVTCVSCHRIFVSTQLSEKDRREVADKVPFAERADRFSINKLELDLVRIKPGKFLMGNAMGRLNERPEHEVTISEPFYFATCPVTQAQYRDIMEASPSYFVGDECPVETVSWYEALEFCRRLTELEQVAGRLNEKGFFRLPTEAEWEYVARLGEKGEQSDTQTSIETVLLGEKEAKSALSSTSWFQENSDGTTHPIARKAPSALGIYDMLGNVSEWCLDWYEAYPSQTAGDPPNPAKARRKVRRGGGWSSVASRCRSTDRAGVLPECRCALIGFRVVLVEAGEAPYARDFMLV